MQRFQGIKIPRIQHNAVDLTEQSLAYQDAHPIPFAKNVTKNRDYEKLLLQNELNTTTEYKTFYVGATTAESTYTFETDVQNVTSFEIISVTFPNVQPTVNLGNNMFYWSNQEDIDNGTVTTDKGVPAYPVYSVSIRPGNYGVDTLMSRLADATQRIPRNNKDADGTDLGTKHYFVFDTDYPTNNVEVHNLDIFQVTNISTTIDSSIVTITLKEPVSKEFVVHEQIYIIGAQTFNGIPSTLLNGIQNIVSVISTTQVMVDVSVPSTQTGEGGGTYIRLGRPLEFKLLAGDYYSSSLFKSLGFPNINSLMMIGTTIKNVRNVSLSLLVDFAVTDGYRGYFSDDEEITGDATGYLVEATNEGVLGVLTDYISGTVSIASSSFATQSTDVEPRNVSCFLIETQDAHNYSSSDIGSSVTIDRSQTIGQDGLRFNSGYDGTYEILYVVSKTALVVRGICPLYAELVNYELGTLNTPNPFTTASFFVASIEQNNTDLSALGIDQVAKITITDMDEKFFTVGDTVTIVNGIVSTVSTWNLAVLHVDAASSCIYTSNLPNTSIEVGTTTISSNVLTLRLPGHGVSAVDTVVTYTDGTFGVTFTNRTLASFAAGDEFYTQTSNSPYTVTSVDSDFVYCSQNISTPVAPGGVLMLSPKVQFLNETLALRDCTFRSVIDEDHVQINSVGFNESRTPTALAKYGNTSGGTVVYLSSEIHGFDHKQTNHVGQDVYAPIDLAGPNHLYLQIPELANLNTPKRPRPFSVPQPDNTKIDSTFAVIKLGQPGTVSYKIESQKLDFESPLHTPSLTFRLLNEDGTLYDLKHHQYTLGIRVGILTSPLVLREREKRSSMLN